MVAHATLSLLRAEVDRVPGRTELRRLVRLVPDRFAALFATNIDVESLRGLVAVDVDCAVRVVALKALRFAAPALRAAIGFDGASREPRIAIIDGPPRGS